MPEGVLKERARAGMRVRASWINALSRAADQRADLTTRQIVEDGLGAGHNLVYGKNAAEESVPLGAVVSIYNSNIRQPRWNFVGPKEQNHDEPYGILLGTCAIGQTSAVAIGGGPWAALVSSGVEMGDRLSPANDPTTATTDYELTTEYNGLFIALSTPSDGYAAVAFLGTGGGIEIRDDDPLVSDCWKGRIWFNRNAI